MPSESPEQPTQPASSASPQLAQQSQSDGSLRTQLVRFIAVGVVCAVIDYGTTLLLDYVLGVPRGWAKAVGWVAGTTTAFVMIANCPIYSPTSAKATVAVAILYLSTFAVQNILYKVVPMPLHSFELPKFVVDTISFVIAQGVATVTNFVMQRAFIFKQR